MLRYHTLNYLTEPIYIIDNKSDEEDINYVLSSFFEKLINRRRSDDTEFGLQAGGVIYPDRAGFKICERDYKNYWSKQADLGVNVTAYNHLFYDFLLLKLTNKICENA